MKKIIKYIRDVIVERKWLREKPCAACEHFDHYMGSAGVCYAKSGCPATRMRDYSDFCDCGCFKKRRRVVMAEKEYVERDELESRIKKYVKCRDADRETLEWAKDECIRQVHCMPAADVVEVVRCKDCPHLIKEIVEEETSYGFTDDHEVFGCGRILELTGKWVDVFLDDFCSYGERKEGE